MRILVASDGHGAAAPIEKAICNLKPDCLIYLGDGCPRIEDMSHIYKDIKFYFVKGNIDYGSYDLENEEIIGSKRIFFTHGDRYDVKYSYDKIIAQGKLRNADIVLFGHTHIPYTECIDGMYVMNPGSFAHPQFGKPSFGFIDIVGKNIVTNIVYI